MDKPKRPPPVPKFEDKNDKAELEKKLNSFINSITQPQPQPEAPKSQPAKPQPVKTQVSAKQEAAGKKKLTLANLNSKLNNMLSAKKITITAAISTEVEKEKKEEHRKAIEIQYDPQHPNSYELSKHIYAAQLAALASDSEEEEDQKMDEQQPQEQTEMVEEQWQPEEKQQLALRMMQKFGYKVGEGLGKQGQGIRTPLIVRKTTDSSGIIEQSTIPLNYLIPPEVSARNALAAHSVEPTEVLVLVGVISMAELQQGLQEEIRQECCLYGVVIDWLLYLFEGELRIFVQFQTKEQALNAFVKMNGKYFGERLVSVRFYPLQRFKERVLSDSLHAHIPT